MSTISYKNPEPSPWTSTSPRGKKNLMYGLYMYHRKFAIKTRDKFQYQRKLIRLSLTKNSETNDATIRTKTPKGNTFKSNVLIKLSHGSNPWKKVLSFNHLEIIPYELYNRKRNLKRLFPPINDKKGKTHIINPLT